MSQNRFIDILVSRGSGACVCACSNARSCFILLMVCRIRDLLESSGDSSLAGACVVPGDADIVKNRREPKAPGKNKRFYSEQFIYWSLVRLC